jgi:hypothetical protein
MCGFCRFILVAMFLTTLVDYSKESFNGQPKFIIKAQGNQAFHESCHIGTFHLRTQNIAECLEQCLQDCRCQSFQICQNTKCQLCSSHKEENSSLLREEDGCVYATYEMRQSTTVQVICRIFWNIFLSCNSLHSRRWLNWRAFSVSIDMIAQIRSVI